MHDRKRRKETAPPRHLAIGKVLKPWGLKGAVKVQSYAESPESFLRIPEVRVQGERGTVVLALESVRKQRKSVLLKFRGRDRVEDVEALVGRTLYMDEKHLRGLEEGEYYWHQLIGMEVRTDAGTPVGTLEEILDTGSHDVYVVRQGQRETLIPAVRDVVQKVDLAARQMIIRAMEGLLSGK